MAIHEFGIMEHEPLVGERFDDYEPQKYNCVSVDDENILALSERLSQIQFYWHSVDITGNGLAYCGITLISPEKANEMLNIIKDIPELSELTVLLNRAYREGKYVIHFGI
ncbi:MAG: hypothetical protein ACI4IM_04910 [Acutalibacteraceae bacterium]